MDEDELQREEYANFAMAEPTVSSVGLNIGNLLFAVNAGTFVIFRSATNDSPTVGRIVRIIADQDGTPARTAEVNIFDDRQGMLPPEDETLLGLSEVVQTRYFVNCKSHDIIDYAFVFSGAQFGHGLTWEFLGKNQLKSRSEASHRTTMLRR